MKTLIQELWVEWTFFFTNHQVEQVSTHKDKISKEMALGTLLWHIDTYKDIVEYLIKENEQLKSQDKK